MRVEKIALLLMLSAAVACGDDDTTPAADGSETDMDKADIGAGPTDPTGDTGDDDSLLAPSCEAAEVSCVDEQIVMLDLYEDPYATTVTNEDLGGTFRTTIDSSAGGLSPTESYAYLRFTEAGAELVPISDVEAFESQQWDIAARRFILRLNSGASGPSCVSGARTAGGTEFESLDAVPEGLDYRVEEYFQDDCSFVSDGSGIGSPGAALASFWTYGGCVQMSKFVYVVQLASGRHVKLQVETYYTPDVQQVCDESGSLPDGPSGAGNLQILWGFLD